MASSPTSPIDSTSSSPVDSRANRDIRANPNPNPNPNPNGYGPPHRSHTIDVFEDRIDSGFRSIRSFTQRNQKSSLHSLQEWTPRSRPYHDYVHQLVAAGWRSLQDLDTYMGTEAQPDPELTISAIDIHDDFRSKRWPNMHSEHELKSFMDIHNRIGANVRLYVAEYDKHPSPLLIEVLGAALKLDPRFFLWAIHGMGHVFSPSQRHRAPYVSIGFGVLDLSTPRKTDAKRFKTMIYIQPDATGRGWTGVILFGTHTKLNISPRILTDPPPFGSQLPPPIIFNELSLRELYIQSLEFISLERATKSPLYAVSTVLHLNCFLWNQIITAIREEDQRVGGISDTTIGHTEEIKKSYTVVQRGGTLGWHGMDEQTRDSLVEDFKHLVEQTELLWQTRDKMAAIRQRNSDTRWSALTNAFTYLFAPVTIISGVYGMNVSQISGTSSNPSIWQPFVCVAVMNILVLFVLAGWNWIHIQVKHGRVAGMKEVFGFAVGKISVGKAALE